MNSIGDTSTHCRSRKVFKLRKKNAQKNLTKNTILLGYILIIYQYIKFNTSSWILVFRLILQTLISSPFPSDNQLVRVIQRVRNNNNNTTDTATNNHNNATDTNRYSFAINNMTASIPGAFSEGISTSQNNESFNIDEEVINFKKRLRTSLFHAIILINITVLIYRLFNRINFIDMSDGNGLIDTGLTNTPSLFLNGNGISQGELRGGLTLQLIGERLPTNNYVANLQIWFLDLFIFLSQFTLLTLTSINFIKLGYKEPKEIRYTKSDGYDGFLIATQINYSEALNEFLS